METLKQKDIKGLINSGMHKLSKEDYKILHELYFNDTSIHQLSKNLGIARSTTRYMRDRALDDLKKIIASLQK